MSITEVKYAVANNLLHAIEPKKNNDWFHRLRFFYDLIPRCVTLIKIELKMETPSGYFEKIYPRSSLLKKYFFSCDAGVIYSDFRVTVLILMTNNSKHSILIKPGQRIAQIVFQKKEFLFKKVDCLSSTKIGAGGLDSTGI